MSDLDKKNDLYEEEEESRFDESDYDLFVKNSTKEDQVVNEYAGEPLFEEDKKKQQDISKKNHKEKNEIISSSNQTKNNKKLKKTNKSESLSDELKKEETFNDEELNENKSENTPKVLTDIDRSPQLEEDVSNKIDNNIETTSLDTYEDKKMDNKKIEEASSNINFDQVNYILFEKNQIKPKKANNSLIVKCLMEFFYGVSDLIEIAARFAFLCSFFTIGIIFLILNNYLKVKKKSFINFKKLIYDPFLVYLRPAFDGRFVPFIIFNSTLIYFFNYEKLSYSNNIMYAYIIIISSFFWPLYRLIRSIITKDVLRNNFVVNGLPYKYNLKRNLNIKDSSLNWAYKNVYWTDTSKLDTKEIRKLDKDFEVITAEVFWRLGFAVNHNGKSGDGGKDVIATDENGKTLIISCKRFSSIVPPNYVRELYGIVQSEKKTNNDVIGVLVTTVGYSDNSLDYAKKHDLILLTLDQLIKILESPR